MIGGACIALGVFPMTAIFVVLRFMLNMTFLGGLGVMESRKVPELTVDAHARCIQITRISHKMPEMFKAAERVHVDRLDKRPCRIDPKDTTLSGVVAFITGAKEPRKQPTV